MEVTLTGEFFGENPDVTDFVVIPKRNSSESYEDVHGKRTTVMDIKTDNK